MNNPMSQNVFQLSASGDQKTHLGSAIFDRTIEFGIEGLYFKSDPVTGLKAIIAIHNTIRGPALGGTRCMFYTSESHAIEDVMKLARGMSYKSAFADLPYGGGKAVLMRPQHIKNPDAFFESYGEFINTLNGHFITAVDVGTSVADMDKISRRTRFVLSTSSSNGDPSQDTAKGVLQGIKAAAKVHLDHDDLEGVKVAIQGVGKVGFHLAQFLHLQGAHTIISDIDAEAVQRCADTFKTEIVSTDQIVSVPCDVLAPCALGNCINSHTINRINSKIICGAANNQLASDQIGDLLFQKKIFYVPDYVANAGGLIHVVIASNSIVQAKVTAIYDAVIDIYEHSKQHHEPSHRVANRIAEQILSHSKKLVAHL